MLKNILVMALTLSTVSFMSSISHAEEMSAPSYMAKKQGRVPFTVQTEETAATEMPATEDNIQAIEPAAGAEEPMETQSSTTALEENIRLPRKN